MTSSTRSRDEAFAFATSEDWARAVPAARKALAADPQDAYAQALLALGLAHVDQPREAVDSTRRAVALDPELLFLDEPTSGLDPISAAGFDELVQNLREWLKLTIVIITHDLDSLWRIADRVAVLGNGKVLGCGTMEELSRSADPLLHEYFHGPRGRAAREQAWNRK